MNAWNGKMQSTVEVHCAGCETNVLGLPSDRTAAADELRSHYGWATRKGLWHCAACKDNPEMIGRRG